MKTANQDCVDTESYNHLGWKRPLRSSTPTVAPTTSSDGRESEFPQLPPTSGPRGAKLSWTCFRPCPNYGKKSCSLIFSAMVKCHIIQSLTKNCQNLPETSAIHRDSCNTEENFVTNCALPIKNVLVFALKAVVETMA